ncbi:MULTISPECIES: DUF6932 family protein [Streptococcus]|uniref:DUF6932 family protein n=1 Tax=Streptococcus TaxID=1301 RepID=UPI0013DAE839|nr:hypothetical protein [Streptococcus canis]QKG74675.1 hypothetical protein GE023_010535 [Streptococcus canis]
MMQFNSHGNLEGGIIAIKKLSEIEEFLVDSFTTSQTRKRNFNSFKKFIQQLDTSRVQRVWMDGSFCSNKIDPNDIDCVVFVNPLHNDYITYLSEQHDGLKGQYLDVYVTPDKETIDFSLSGAHEAYHQADYQEKYWQGQFGFDRNREHKAIIELRLDGED